MTRLVESKDPEQLNPESMSTWHYESIGDMLKDGLYGYDVIETMNKMILFHVLRLPHKKKRMNCIWQAKPNAQL
jgi:hypothetical protein